MAGAAADLAEYMLPGKRCRGCRQGRIARRNFRAADELRKVIDVAQPQLVRNIFRVRRDLPYARLVLRPQSVRDSHFVQVGVSDEREQAAVLVFPAKAADAGLTRRLQNGNLDGFAMNPAAAP